MDTLAVIDHVFPARFSYHFPGRFQLFQCGKGRLIRKIVLACRHHPKPQSAPLACHCRAAHQLHLRVGENLFLARRCFRGGKAFLKSLHLLRVRIIDPLHNRARLRQTVAHSIDMPVIQRHGCNLKFSRANHRGGLSLRRIVHSILLFHVYLLLPFLQAGYSITHPQAQRLRMIQPVLCAKRLFYMVKTGVLL